MCQLCTDRCWLDVARHADGCQLQLGLRATGYWLVKQEAFEKCWAHSLLRAVLHCQSPGVATASTVARHLCIDVHDDDDDNDNA